MLSTENSSRQGVEEDWNRFGVGWLWTSEVYLGPDDQYSVKVKILELTEQQALGVSLRCTKQKQYQHKGQLVRAWF